MGLLKFEMTSQDEQDFIFPYPLFTGLQGYSTVLRSKTTRGTEVRADGNQKWGPVRISLRLSMTPASFRDTMLISFAVVEIFKITSFTVPLSNCVWLAPR